ncbi:MULTISPECIES: toll/interleukin-1 receptor domain-containing protein [Luteimonas]|uniref:toll/interleukin-1 receptor domain-containing protein n=1 Tax=Luteimonas TaxID=83614 RepID=UPI000C7BB56A|nr:MULTISPECIES: toll/interleukin-1 receptor domain-containing protein [Luteimonas]
MDIPKVFVSYSHDSLEHKKWVLDLGIKLRNSGVDASLDQWDLRPGDDLPAFMENKLRTADRVLMVCTAPYVEKANSGKGGVGYEKMIVTSDLMRDIDSSKVIPIIRQFGTSDVPTFLKSKLYIDFSSDDQMEFSFDELVRTIHGAPLFEKPPIGNNPFQPASEVSPDKTGDPIKLLMRQVVADFETGATYTIYKNLVSQVGISRIYLDILIAQAIKQDLISTDQDGDLYLSEQGKHYAIQHRLVHI